MCKLTSVDIFTNCGRSSHATKVFSTLMSATKLSQKLGVIAASWPTDPFRPTLQLKSFLQSLSTHPNLTPKAVAAANSLKDNVITKKVYILSTMPYRMELMNRSVYKFYSIHCPRRPWSRRRGPITTIDF